MDRTQPHRILFLEVAAMVRENPHPYLGSGASPTATQGAITHAYRTRLRTHHPDTHRSPSSHTAGQHLRQVLVAYALLRDPTRRTDSDRATATAATPVTRPARAPIAVIVQNHWLQPEPLDHPQSVNDTENHIMGIDISHALDQPGMAGATPKPARDKVMRIATMTTRLLDEIHTQILDTASLDRLRAIDSQIIGELLTDLTPDLRQELQRLALPLTRHTELSHAELRLAHAQLVGWLQGLLQTAQTALNDRHAVLANDSTTGETPTGTFTSSNIPTSPNQFGRPLHEPWGPPKCLPDDMAPNQDNPAIRSARQTLITAITRRITQKCLTAAQAAVLLHLTGPRATKLLQANIDEFTLDELINLLPALELSIQVIPTPEQYVEHSTPRERPPND